MTLDSIIGLQVFRGRFVDWRDAVGRISETQKSRLLGQAKYDKKVVRTDMQKRIRILLSLLLLCMCTILSACGLLDNRSEKRYEFQELLEEIVLLEEYRFSGTLVLELQGNTEENFMMHTQMRGTVSERSREVWAVFSYANASRETVADLELIIQENKHYVNSTSLLYHRLGLALDEIEQDTTELTVADVVPFTWVEHYREQSFEQGRIAPFSTGAYFDAWSSLTRDGARFTIALEANEIRHVTGDIFRLLSQTFAADAGFARIQMLETLATMLATEENLEYARFSITTSRTEEGFLQTIALDIPNKLHVWGTFSFVPEVIFPLAAVEDAVNIIEFEDFFLDLDVRALFPGLGSAYAVDIVIAYTPLTLQLKNQDLRQSPLLVPSVFPNAFGAENHVATPAGQAVVRADNSLRVDAGAIAMYYLFTGGSDAAQSIAEQIAKDRAGYFLAGSEFLVQALYTNEPRELAVMSILEYTASGMHRIHFYFAEAIDETQMLSLSLKLYLDLFTASEFALLEELQYRLQVDLLEIIWDFAKEQEALQALLPNRE